MESDPESECEADCAEEMSGVVECVACGGTTTEKCPECNAVWVCDACFGTHGPVHSGPLDPRLCGGALGISLCKIHSVLATHGAPQTVCREMVEAETKIAAAVRDGKLATPGMTATSGQPAPAKLESEPEPSHTTIGAEGSGKAGESEYDHSMAVPRSAVRCLLESDDAAVRARVVVTRINMADGNMIAHYYYFLAAPQESVVEAYARKDYVVRDGDRRAVLFVANRACAAGWRGDYGMFAEAFECVSRMGELHIEAGETPDSPHVPTTVILARLAASAVCGAVRAGHRGFVSRFIAEYTGPGADEALVSAIMAIDTTTSADIIGMFDKLKHLPVDADTDAIGCALTDIKMLHGMLEYAAGGQKQNTLSSSSSSQDDVPPGHPVSLRLILAAAVADVDDQIIDTLLALFAATPQSTQTQTMDSLGPVALLGTVTSPAFHGARPDHADTIFDHFMRFIADHGAEQTVRHGMIYEEFPDDSHSHVRESIRSPLSIAAFAMRRGLGCQAVVRALDVSTAVICEQMTPVTATSPGYYMSISGMSLRTCAELVLGVAREAMLAAGMQVPASSNAWLHTLRRLVGDLSGMLDDPVPALVQIVVHAIISSRDAQIADAIIQQAVPFVDIRRGVDFALGKLLPH